MALTRAGSVLLLIGGLLTHSGLVQVGAWSRLVQVPVIYDVCIALAAPAWPGLARPDVALVRPGLEWPNLSWLPFLRQMPQEKKGWRNPTLYLARLLGHST